MLTGLEPQVGEDAEARMLREREQRHLAPVGEGQREHLPPASSSLDTYTLLKFYSLTAPILQSVFRGLQDAEVSHEAMGSSKVVDL